MRHLTICHAESRRLHGSDYYPQPSRFIREIPAALLREVRLGGPINGIGSGGVELSSSDTGLILGQRVLHKSFGEGVVLHLEGNGENARVQVNFEDDGIKWLVVAYAGLEAC